jgi:hypothetical protein
MDFTIHGERGGKIGPADEPSTVRPSLLTKCCAMRDTLLDSLGSIPGTPRRIELSWAREQTVILGV